MIKDLQKKLLYTMLLIREFENTVSKEKLDRNIYGSAHCYNGEEAVAVGVCAALEEKDYIISGHRPHGHAIAKGMNIKPMMAEIFGKSTGSNAGKGGSMHIQDASVGLIAATGIVGSGIPLGCGAAFSAKYKKNGRIACVFFGDGAANEGTLHESFNLAAKWQLPVLFVLEDNGLAVTTSTRVTSAVNDYVVLAKAYGITGFHVEGQDVEAVYKIAEEATRECRERSRPSLVQAHTIRFNEHAEGEYYLRMREKEYRDYERLDKEKKERCPIRLYISKLTEKALISDAEVLKIQREVEAQVADALRYAKESAVADSGSALSSIYA